MWVTACWMLGFTLSVGVLCSFYCSFSYSFIHSWPKSQSVMIRKSLRSNKCCLAVSIALSSCCLQSKVSHAPNVPENLLYIPRLVHLVRQYIQHQRLPPVNPLWLYPPSFPWKNRDVWSLIISEKPLNFLLCVLEPVTGILKSAGWLRRGGRCILSQEFTDNWSNKRPILLTCELH